MANIKFSLAFAVVSCFLLAQSPVAAQAPPKTTVDFILDVVELLSEELINRLASIQLPEFKLPTLPQIQLPEIPSFPDIQFPSIGLSEVDQMPYNPYLQYGTKDYKLWAQQYLQGLTNNYLPNYQNPQYIKPPQHGKPPCDNCEPEKVKIIVIDDCDEKKSSEESSEESNEQKVTYRKGRYNYKKFNKN
ncbi:unnamed protein product [Diamesa serratosioi]